MPIHGEPETDSYVQWLQKNGVPLFEGGGVLWRSYHDCLVPVSLKPKPFRLEPAQSKDLLRRSGALFLRYFTATYEKPTSFWYTACTRYRVESLSAHTRYEIRRGYKCCVVRQIDPAWLAGNGYSCYLAAFSRYENATPEPEHIFRKLCLDAVDGPFEFWGAFAGDKLIGFMKCTLGTDYVASVVLKLDPAFLSFRTSYVLKDTVLRKYVTEQGKTTYDGFRAISHQTNAHDFFLKFGCHRNYCDLQIAYRPAVAAMVRVLYPLRATLSRAASFPLARKAQILLTQEQIRRSFFA